jgi:hypothetical protein
MEAFMKKSTWFLTGVLAIALVFGLLLTGCPTGNDDSDGGGGGGGGSLTWTVPAYEGSTLYSIAYGGTSGKEKFVAATSLTGFEHSPDGKAWEFIPNPFGRYISIGGVVYGGGTFVCGRGYSTDGETWTDVNTTFGSVSINSIAYGGASGSERFVAVGDEGKTAYSTDGVSWTAVENTAFVSDYGNDINCIAYGGGKFVAAGDRGKTVYSTDGVSWTAAPVAEFTVKDSQRVETEITSIAYGGGTFVVGGYNLEVGGRVAYSNKQE